ncbi:fumarate/nitrate reduction transcriptional regulator Fnr [Pseudoteredinibacter isoporae]|uniref:CRP/FNR family transcriptional regulator n=1 Tax=Pseudoteredinibacter isoporae TaxID=570281 RepID=A0A7X0JTG1_9GAMM|nr:fumarate/nitrate reduction transcriptional regulator Fnr [Pseudoteredinibacter isoporae]MBB6521408.1 CRP/FNR family transcriptional regulator [Pseudoteredinibacter isoporae]NHO86963.1 fumarate/nitrate reduction transcriptional regulator Fnr [Pseudoteredinibacter isoporae]NIB24584.1 fumarate/nitrate reduction transcriptional regulator Fnr [Pseudoteredinibacter isoporae]
MTSNIISKSPRCHHNPQVSCGDCRLNSICLPISVHVDELDKLDEIIQRGRPLHKGDYLYHANDPFTSVYAVRSGTIKSIRITNDGEEQVTGFHLPGEILGMDGIAQNVHTNSAIALETTAVCEIPFARMEELSIKIPSLQRHFFQLMSQEITADQQLITLLSKNSAEERVASMLLSISTRNHRRHLSATLFRLAMSRADMGNYLGLTVETVSRVLSRFQKQGVLSVDKKEIEILDMDGLRKAARADVC